MTQVPCPVCRTTAEQGRSNGRDVALFRCPRCGPFEISRTALAMLPSRLEADPKSVARASHSIRTRTSEESWLSIDSTQVDGLVSQPLPSLQRQLENLIAWVKTQVGDAHLAAAHIESWEALAAVVGAADTGSLVRLIKWANSDGIVEVQDHAIHLMPKAWEVSIESKKPSAARPMETPEVEDGHCPKCSANRKSDIVAAHEQTYDNGHLWIMEKYVILRCRGCESIFVKRSDFFSEDIDYEEDPHTGEVHSVLVPTITYWPAPARRSRPSWLRKLKDDQLKDLLDEVYSALDGDQRVLAAIGARTALDRAMVLLGADEAVGFAEKLRALESNGLVSRDERDALLVLTDAGSAAAHRAWRPEPDELATIFDGIEAFLHRALIVSSAVKLIRVPPKPQRNHRSGK